MLCPCLEKAPAKLKKGRTKLNTDLLNDQVKISILVVLQFDFQLFASWGYASLHEKPPIFLNTFRFSLNQELDLWFLQMDKKKKRSGEVDNSVQDFKKCKIMEI